MHRNGWTKGGAERTSASAGKIAGNGRAECEALGVVLYKAACLARNEPDPGPHWTKQSFSKMKHEELKETIGG
jgi:hypothetical protein